MTYQPGVGRHDPNNENSTISQEDPRLTEALEPGQLRVIKRNGSLAKFDDIRIEVAMKKAFLLAVEGEACLQFRTHTKYH